MCINNFNFNDCSFTSEYWKNPKCVNPLPRVGIQEPDETTDFWLNEDSPSSDMDVVCKLHVQMGENRNGTILLKAAVFHITAKSSHMSIS